jgi:DNA-binding NarL/FixJ family response regulator
MDALTVFYRVRHNQGCFDALLANLRYVFATGCHFQAMAAVQAQCGYVMRHHGRRPAGREETGAMLGAVTSRLEALELCELHRPQILISYDQLDDGDGLELVREARKRWPELPILLVLQGVNLLRLRQALEVGCTGILADALIAEGHILTALQTVLKGETYLDPSLGALLERDGLGWDPPITPRQLAILQEVVNGLSDRQIAELLAIPFDTVRHQLKQAYRLLGTSNRTHAGLILLQLGLLKPPRLPAVARARASVLQALRQSQAPEPEPTHPVE